MVQNEPGKRGILRLEFPWNPDGEEVIWIRSELVYPPDCPEEVIDSFETLLDQRKYFWDFPPEMRSRFREMLRMETTQSMMRDWAKGRMSYRELYALRSLLVEKGWVTVTSKRVDGRKRKVWVWNPDMLLPDPPGG